MIPLKINHITFVFENGDDIRIDGKYVGEFVVDEMSKSIHRIANNSIMDFDITNFFAIGLYRDANVISYEFNDTNMPSYRVFDRLKNNDITSIAFQCSDKNCHIREYEYYVAWNHDDNEYKNTYQKSYMSELGDLYIVIHPSKTIRAIFNTEELNDEEKSNRKFRLYGCISD